MGLLTGQHLSPALVEDVVRLGVLLPFTQVPALIAHFTGVIVSPATVRRLTEAAGAVREAGTVAAVARIEQELPEPPLGPPLQLLSVDGAMVLLVGGTWSEVKTLALSTVVSASDPAEPVHTRDLSYFSRLTDAATLVRLATLETQRRGTETAQTVVTIVDGAEWCQGFIDHQRHDAVRILDFAHVLAHLSDVAQAQYDPGTPAASEWLGQQAHVLRHGKEETVLCALTDLATTGADEAREVSLATHTYLSQRLDQLRYQMFVAAGYPIGCGCVESANTLVVEARLNGSGMHWTREQVNPMLVLRTLVLNQRWEDEWPQLWTTWRQQARMRTHQRHPSGGAGADVPAVLKPITAPDADAAAQPDTMIPPVAARPKTIVNGKPTADHPWRKTLPFRAKS